MKIAFLVPSLGLQEGQGNVDRELLVRVVRAGHQVDVFAGIVPDEVRALPGVRVHRLPRLPVWQLGNQLLGLGATVSLKRGRYDLVHADAGVTLKRADVMVCHTLSARWLDLPASVWREPGVRGMNNAAATRFKARFEIAQYRAARLVFANSAMTAADLRERGVDEKRIRTLPFGVDAERFRPPTREERTQARTAFGVREEDFVVLLVGAHGERKGLPLALDALSQASAGETLLVAGEHRGGRWVREAAARKLPVVMPGKLDDIRRAYWAADALIAPSRYDAFGMAVLEAMACGLPVIVSAKTGSKELVTDAGFVLEQHSVSELRIAVDTLRTDHELRKTMSARARATAISRDWDTAGALLLQAYTSVAEEAAKGRETSAA